MQDFLHRKNLELYRKRLLETTDPAERNVLVRLLAEEESKDSRRAVERKAAGPD
jgi:hypothetical protein